MAKYIDPFIDFGFKYLFGREESKPYLIDFLNQLLRDEPEFEPIEDIEYLNQEQSKHNKEVRGVIYDIHCKTSTGKMFTVEMQNQPQPYFMERAMYYAAKAIVEQGRPGKKWHYEYMPVYCVAFMRFALDSQPDDFIIHGGMCDLATGKPLTDKLRLILIQTPNFKKRKEECTTPLEQWMYNIINMSKMERMSFTEQNRLFKSLDDMAAYANLSDAERHAYDADVKAYRDWRGGLEYAMRNGMNKGRAEGRAEERIDIARKLKQIGLSIEDIKKTTLLSEEEIKSL